MIELFLSSPWLWIVHFEVPALHAAILAIHRRALGGFWMWTVALPGYFTSCQPNSISGDALSPGSPVNAFSLTSCSDLSLFFITRNVSSGLWFHCCPNCQSTIRWVSWLLKSWGRLSVFTLPSCMCFFFCVKILGDQPTVHSSLMPYESVLQWVSTLAEL